MKNKKKKSVQKVKPSDFDLACSCGSGEVAGACCKSSELCPCGSGERAGACCYASQEEDEG